MKSHNSFNRQEIKKELEMNEASGQGVERSPREQPSDDARVDNPTF